MLSEEEVKDIIEGVLSGKYHASNLPYNLFKYTANELEKAFQSGWDTQALSKPDVYSPDLEMFNSFRKNLWYFSGNKTSQQVKELQAAIYDEQGNRRTREEFTKEALDIDKTFNQRYLEAEYDMTVKLAHSGREWRDILDTKEAFPYLEWVTVMDDNTMDAALNGTIKRVDDLWWDSHPIPYHWGCRCRVRQHKMATVTETPADVPEPAPLFKNNVFKSRMIWLNDEHPYGQNLSKADKKATEKLFIEHQENNPLYKKAKSSKDVNISALHFKNEIETNLKEALKAVRIFNIKLNLPPHHNGKQVLYYKNPDYEYANKPGVYGDLKEPESISGIPNIIEHSVTRRPEAKRNPSFLIFKLDALDFTSFELTNELRRSMMNRNKRIAEIYLMNGTKGVKLTREIITGDFKKALEAVDKIKGGT